MYLVDVLTIVFFVHTNDLFLDVGFTRSVRKSCIKVVNMAQTVASFVKGEI